MNFGRVSESCSPSAAIQSTLPAGIGKVTAGKDSRTGETTAIFDTIYGACRYQFGKIDHAASGNFILLFSDGEDNGSYLPLKEAVDMCRRTNTAIYAFRAKEVSAGAATLAELASETGGRVFRAVDSPVRLSLPAVLLPIPAASAIGTLLQAAELSICPQNSSRKPDRSVAVTVIEHI